MVPRIGRETFDRKWNEQTGVEAYAAMARGQKVIVSDLDIGVSTWRSSVEELSVPSARRILLRNGIRPIGELTVGPFEQLDAVIAASAPDAGDRREVPSSADEVAVVICTRNRADLLAGCLKAVAALDPAPAEVLVVDNGTSDESTIRVTAEFGVRCVVERRIGLDRARNMAIDQTSAPIIAYLDDDARPSTWWAGVVQEAFTDSDIAAVSGLVLAGELDSWSQRAFEGHAGMHKGYEVRTFGIGALPIGFEPQMAGIGANMAFRRSVFDRLGLFDVALDVGTPTGGGGDLDMLFRVYRSGAHIRYDPAMFVRHLHRLDRAALRRQLTNYGVGYRAFLEKLFVAEPANRAALKRQMRRWAMRRFVKGPLVAVVRGDPYRLLLALSEARGAWRGAAAYHQSMAAQRRDDERRTAKSLG